MTLKERFQLVKAAFNGTVPAPAPAPTPAPAPAPAPGAMAAKTYKTKSGTEISINQAGEMPAVGDMVTINGAPAPEGVHELEDGSTITVDATGAITVYTAAPAPVPAPAPAPAPQATPAPVTLSEMTPEQATAMYLKCASGTPEEQLANLWIMVKALMETNFGWKIREGQENTAIQVYKDTVAPPAPSVTIEEMSSVFTKADKFDEQVVTIKKHEDTIKLLMDLCEQLVEKPTAEPVTITGGRKEKFEQIKKDQESRFERMADALKKNRALA